MVGVYESPLRRSKRFERLELFERFEPNPWQDLPLINTVSRMFLAAQIIPATIHFGRMRMALILAIDKPLNRR
jgi:hypothetical protein